ncbi:MAG: hypothetical protein E6L04_06855 [Thaumarchaeota archaeon]|nr:MAG: hypothetical protein E6L04_06855 [Nitrososphaerota archaeon]TLX89025.1 MAG: hypothetical protein E6K97_05865 [Nitrososphaerota archaeon]
MNDNIFETLKGLSRKREQKDNQTCKRKDPSYIYLDENNQIKEIPLSNLNPAASVYINITMNYNYKNPAKLIHDSIFHDS